MPVTAEIRLARHLALAALAGAILNFIAFYPGILHHDAWAYFKAARDNDWTNWQPPLLGFLWIPLQKIYYGPQPMLVLFVAGYWTGFWLIARAMIAKGRSIAIATFLAAFFPMALNFNGQLVKDVSMGICLMLAAGFAACLLRGNIRRAAAPFLWLFLAAGAFMRANSLFALPPLIDLAGAGASRRWAGRGLVQRAVIVCLLSALVAPAHLIADRYLFRVKDIAPISQLQVFDLGGISYFSGADAFQGFFGPAFPAKNRTCYTPRFWDVYGWGGCPEVYENLKPKFGLALSKLWLEGIAAHPLAYLTHRLAHINRFLQFACIDCKEMVFTGGQSTNQTEFTFAPTFLYRTIDAAAQAINDTPFGRPYVFLLVCLAWAWAALAIPNQATRQITLALALSGALYALGFGLVGIASDYRYVFWTMLCAAVTTPVVVARVLSRRDAPLAYRAGPLVLIAAVMLLREIVVRFALG
ncbi:MAG TPA: hypothetical protein VGQ97_03785 [Xanthobacteraceae bacterium]|nr:hypothetical protein [Xanthobacteraceae bacterium]